MIKIALISLLSFLLSFHPDTSIAEIYKWVDDAGNVHFTDNPNLGNSSEKVNINVTIPSQPAPASTQKELNTFSDTASKSTSKKKNNKKVVMYSTAWCPYCKKARSYFKKEKISFTEYDVEKLPRRLKEFKKLGGTGYPLILIGKNQKMQGFSVGGFERRYNTP